jgi:hypothetical protein
VRGRVAARSVFRCTCVLIGLVAAIAVSVPQTARAQGLFDVLRGIFGGGRPPPQRMAPMPLEDFTGADPRAPGADIRIPGDGGGPHASYCVRLCDGRYFPLPANAGTQSPQQLCSAMCPAAKTDVYSGSGIERAASSSGKPYSVLPNAFVYRERLVSDCTCTGKDPTGIARIDVKADPTLRPGDIVVTSDGPVVFQGDRRSRKASDFVPAKDDKRISQQLRQDLSRMRIAQPTSAANVKSEIMTATAPVSVPVPAPGAALGFVPESLSTKRGFGPQK